MRKFSIERGAAICFVVQLVIWLPLWAAFAGPLVTFDTSPLERLAYFYISMLPVLIFLVVLGYRMLLDKEL